jgi:hypothetical protein
LGKVIQHFAKHRLMVHPLTPYLPEATSFYLCPNQNTNCQDPPREGDREILDLVLRLVTQGDIEALVSELNELCEINEEGFYK